MVIGSIFMILIIPLMLIFAFGIPVLLAVLVYRDANKRMDCSPWLWALVAALVPSFIGVIVYLIVRRDYPLKPEYRTYGATGGDFQGYGQYTQPGPGTYGEAGQNGSGYSENGYSENGAGTYAGYPPEKKGIPTWAKALIIIGVVIFAICVIGIIVSIINYFVGYNAAYSYHDGFHYGF